MAVGLVINLARNALYDVPLQPIRTGLAPLIAMSLIGALYAVGVLGWLMVRRLNVR